MARSLLMQRAMLSHHDMQPFQAPRDEAARGVEAMVVATFLKPHFRMGVAPTSGELQVRVEPRAVEPRCRPVPRH